MNKFLKLTIGDIAYLGDGAHTKVQRYDKGILYLSAKNIKKGFIDYSEVDYISEKDFEKLFSETTNSIRDLKTNDILFSIIGSVGNVYLYKKNDRFGISSSIAIIRVHNSYVEVKYLYWYLRSKFFSKLAQRVLSNSVQNYLNLPLIRTLPIYFPDKLSIQKKIVNILDNIDNKIKLNNKINNELKVIAKTIYDYWFLQFEFPNEEGKPYKSSGGKMVWNEELKREIPEGWEVNKLGKICITLLGGTPDTKNEKFWNGNIPWLNSGEVAAVSPIIKSEKTITEQAMNNSSTSFAKSGTVLISITRYIVPSILAIDSCFNQSVVAILPNNLYHTAFLYPFMKSQVNRYMSLRIGAQQPHINKQIIDDTNICIPPIDILNKYYLITENLYKLQMKFAKENQELTSLRDFLLPLLMNGQVGFKEDKAEG